MRFPFDKQFFPLLSTSFPNRSSKSQHQVKSSIFQLRSYSPSASSEKIETGKSFTFDSFHAVNGMHNKKYNYTYNLSLRNPQTLHSPCHITYIDFTIITNLSCHMTIAFPIKRAYLLQISSSSYTKYFFKSGGVIIVVNITTITIAVKFSFASKFAASPFAAIISATSPRDTIPAPILIED